MRYINRAATAAGFLCLFVIFTNTSPVQSGQRSAADKVCIEKPWNQTLSQDSWNFHQLALQLNQRAGVAPRTNLQIVRADATVGMPIAIACPDFRHIVLAHPNDALALNSYSANPILLLAYWTAVVIAESGRDSRQISEAERREAQLEAAARMDAKRDSNKRIATVASALESHIQAQAKTRPIGILDEAVARKHAERIARILTNLLVSPATAAPHNKDGGFDGIQLIVPPTPRRIHFEQRISATRLTGVAFHGEADKVGGRLIRDITEDACARKLEENLAVFGFAEFVAKQHGVGHCGLLPVHVRLNKGDRRSNPVFGLALRGYKVVYAP